VECLVEPVGPAEVAGQGYLSAESRVHVRVDEAGGEQAAGGGVGAGRRRLGSARADLADESVPDAHSVLAPERVPLEDGDIEAIEMHCCLPTALSKLGRVAVAAFRLGSSAASGGGASRSQGPVRSDEPKVCPESLFSVLAADRKCIPRLRCIFRPVLL